MSGLWAQEFVLHSRASGPYCKFLQILQIRRILFPTYKSDRAADTLEQVLVDPILVWLYAGAVNRS